MNSQDGLLQVLEVARASPPTESPPTWRYNLTGEDTAQVDLDVSEA